MTGKLSGKALIFVLSAFLCLAMNACLVNSQPKERDAADSWDLPDDAADDRHQPDTVDGDGRDDDAATEADLSPDISDLETSDLTDVDADEVDGDIMDAIDEEEIEIEPVENFCNYIGGSATEIVTDIVQTGDGGYLLAGFTRSYGIGAADMLLLKLNSRLEIEWAQTIGGEEEDGLYSAVETGPGQYILAGWTMGFGLGGRHLLLLSISSAGSIGWTYAFGVSGPARFTRTADGGYFVAGSNGETPADVRAIKFDALGTIEWATAFGWPGNEWVSGVVQTPDNGFAITGGKTGDGAENQTVVLIKLDSGGGLEWSRWAGGAMNDNPESLHLTADNGFLISGTTDSFGPENNNVMIMKFDSAGTFSLGWTLGSSAYEHGKDSMELADGSFAVIGYSYSTFGEDDMLAAHLDSSGALLWARLIPGIAREEGDLVRRQPGGGYIFAGYSTDAMDADRQIHLLTIDDEGAACTGASVTLSTGTFTPSISSPLPTVTTWTPTPDTVEPNAAFCTPAIEDCCD